MMQGERVGRWRKIQFYPLYPTMSVNLDKSPTVSHHISFSIQSEQGIFPPMGTLDLLEMYLFRNREDVSLNQKKRLSGEKGK